MSTQTLAGYELASPLLNAAGSINGVNAELIVRDVDTLTQTGIGAITLGSFTVQPQAGNEVKYGLPIYHHDVMTGRTYNSMGLPNIGVDEAVRLAPLVVNRAHDQEKVVIYSGSPTNAPEECGSSVDQAVRLAYRFLSTDADLAELNVSCPNVVTESGDRKPIMGYDLESMAELVERLYDEVGDTGRLGLKLPPYLSPEDELLIPELARIIHGKRVFRFLTTSNTIPNQVALNNDNQPILAVPEGKGGMSGPATKEVGREQLVLWRQHTDLEIVSTLGVDSGREVKHRLDLGAVAAGGVTFLWQSSKWKDAVTKMLTELADVQQ
jgi:dihydroorotate dehydrogenase